MSKLFVPMFVSAGLATLSLPSIAQENQSFSFQLEPDTTESTAISLRQGEYLRGALESNAALSSVAMFNGSGELKRRFMAEGQSSARIHFVAQHSDNYRLQIKSSSNAADVTLSFEVPELLEDVENASPSVAILSPKIKALRDDLANDKQHALEAFWRSAREEGTPLVEPLEGGKSLLTFVWQGEHREVKLFGAPFGHHQALTKLPESDVWYASYEVPNGTRMSYKFAPDIPQLKEGGRAQRVAILASAQKDPLNKFPWHPEGEDKYLTQSTISLADAPSAEWTENTPDQAGSVTHHHVSSERLGNTRKISIYRPSVTGSTTKLPVLFVFDGDAYLTKVPTPRILDNLIASGEIPPMNAVFVNNPTRASRSDELPPNPDFAYFMAKELVPWLAEEQGITFNPQDAILTGSSYGGLASLYVAYSHPDVFGNVLSQSGSFWWSPLDNKGEYTEPQWLTRQIAASEKQPIRVYLNAGLFETGHSSIDILESNRHMRDVLTAKGYAVIHEEFASGHDYFSWRVTLANGLRALFKS